MKVLQWHQDIFSTTLPLFQDYFKHLKALKQKYASKINIFAGMETEAYTGYQTHINHLISLFQPDYIVGSVHHINDICFDYSKKDYDRAVADCGSHDALYDTYFDLQYEMIKTLKPFIVGHFDLIRIYDKAFKKRVLHPRIDQKIRRNLALIKELDLVMDFNLRPLARGEKEPYITDSILKTARKMEIHVVPGDDSHGVNEAGRHVKEAVRILDTLGFGTKWPDPVLLT